MLTIFLVIANSSKDSIFPTISLEIESLIRPQNRPTETMCKKREKIFPRTQIQLQNYLEQGTYYKFAKKNVLESPVMVSFFAK